MHLLEPHQGMAAWQTLGPGDAFGHMGCLTGTPRATTAVATAETRLWVLPLAALEAEIAASHELAEHVGAFLRSHDVFDYLSRHHNLEPPQVRAWVDH